MDVSCLCCFLWARILRAWNCLENWPRSCIFSNRLRNPTLSCRLMRGLVLYYSTWFVCTYVYGWLGVLVSHGLTLLCLPCVCIFALCGIQKQFWHEASNIEWKPDCTHHRWPWSWEHQLHSQHVCDSSISILDKGVISCIQSHYVQEWNFWLCSCRERQCIVILTLN